MWLPINVCVKASVCPPMFVSAVYRLFTPEAADRIKAVCPSVQPQNNASAAFVGAVIDECVRLIIVRLL